jgi:hypothetical protein
MVSLTISNLTNGSHTFKARLMNTGSVYSPYAYLQPIVVDTIQPNAPVLSSTTGAYSDSSSIVFNVIGEVLASYSLFDGSSSLVSGTLSNMGRASIPISNLLDRDYNFKVRLTDSVGNIGSFSNILQIRVITRPPIAPTITPTPSQSSQTVTISGEVGTRYSISMTDAADISGVMVSGGITYSYSNLLYTKTYSLSVMLKDAAGNSSSSTRTWTPPLTLSVSGVNLRWNGKNGVTYSIYKGYNSSLSLLGNSFNPVFSLVPYGGLSMNFYVYDPSLNYGQYSSLPIQYDTSFANVSLTNYLTQAITSGTPGSDIKTTMTSYRSSFTSTVTTLTGLDCSKLIDETKPNQYQASYYQGRTFTILLGVSSNLLTTDLPQSPDNILYIAASPNTTVRYNIASTTVNMTVLSSSIIIGNSSYGLGSIFSFGRNNYKIVGFSSIIAEPYLVPQDLTLVLNVLSWTGHSANTLYRVYDTDVNTLIGTTINTTYDLTSVIYPLATYYVVGQSSTGDSTSAYITYMPPSSSFEASGTLLRWNYYIGLGLSYNLYKVEGSSHILLASSSSLTYDISGLNLTPGSYSLVYRAVSNGYTSPNSNTISVTIQGEDPNQGEDPTPPVPPITPAVVIPCFLYNAPVLTPVGYTKISKLSVGDEVTTADGRNVKIQRILKKTVVAGPSTNPYTIPKGMYGATHNLAISPNHRVVVKDGSLVEARFLGIKQQERDYGETIEYYNIELPDWQNDIMIVAGVAVESLAPVQRITMPLNLFKAHIVAKYGRVTPAILALIEKTCSILPDGRVECPVLIQKKK